MRRLSRLAFALPLILLAPRAFTDLTAKPNAYTEQDHFRESLEFNLKTLVDAYKTIGKNNPAWDQEAVRFLDASAKHFAAVNSQAVHRPPGPFLPELIKLAEAAVKKGCDD